MVYTLRAFSRPTEYLPADKFARLRNELQAMIVLVDSQIDTVPTRGKRLSYSMPAIFTYPQSAREGSLGWYKTTWDHSPTRSKILKRQTHVLRSSFIVRGMVHPGPFTTMPAGLEDGLDIPLDPISKALLASAAFDAAAGLNRELYLKFEELRSENTARSIRAARASRLAAVKKLNAELASFSLE